MTFVITPTGTATSQIQSTLSTAGATRLRVGPTTNALEVSNNGGDYFPVAGMTPEGGLFTSLINKTGAPSVRGTVVHASPGTDFAFALQSDEYDAFGIVYDNGIADGQLCRIVFAGQADVMLKDGTGSTREHVVFAADTDGRAVTSAVPVPPNADAHFKEIGHCLQTVGPGASVLFRAMIHFN